MYVYLISIMYFLKYMFLFGMENKETVLNIPTIILFNVR